MARMDKMYDVLKFQCSIITCDTPGHNSADCSNGAHIFCRCLKSDKIPTMELRFIMDQRDKEGLLGGRLMMRQFVNKEESRKQLKKTKRDMKQPVLEEKRKVMVNVPMELEDKEEGVSTDEREEINQDIDPDFTIKKNTQHRTDITLFAAEVI